MIALRRCLSWSLDAAPPLMLGAALWAAGGGAWGQTVPRAPSAASLTMLAPPAPARSVVFDGSQADELRLRQQPAYVESIIVEGRDPDVRRGRRKSLEQTFADALLAPPPAAAAGMRGLNPTPCYAVQSSLNTIGSSFAPLTGCPGYANSP